MSFFLSFLPFLSLSFCLPFFASLLPSFLPSFLPIFLLGLLSNVSKLPPGQLSFARAMRESFTLNGEGPGEGHPKQRNAPAAKAGSVSPTNEWYGRTLTIGPHNPYQMTAAAPGHTRALQDACAQRGTQANKSAQDCNTQRTPNVHLTHTQDTLNARRNMHTSANCERGKTFKEVST